VARDKFLRRVSLASAREAIVEHTRRTGSEQVAPGDALGRITAQPVFARFASPHYRASAMDGIAVRSADLTAASADRPIELVEIEASAEPSADRPACAAVDTGSTMPDWADAVVRIENTKRSPGGFVVVEPVPPARDVRRIGEDVEADALLFGSGHLLRPYDIGAMLATGVASVAVRRRPRVAMLATGSEIVEPGGAPKAGQVIEYNSRMMAAYVREWGGEPVYLGCARDERDELARAITAAARDNDIVCVIAGSSAGRKDLTVDVIEQTGTLLVHGVDMMPGKPASIAVVGTTPVLGIPGYPVSAVVAYQQLLAPALAAALGTVERAPATLCAEVRRKIASRLGVEEFVRVCLARDARGWIAVPLARGAGSISTLVRADAILRIGAGSEGLDVGTTVEVELLGPLSDLEHNVVVGGRPDAFCATLEEVGRRTLAGLRCRHLRMAEWDTLAALARGEVELAVLGTEDPRACAELEQELARRTDAAAVFVVRARESPRATHVVVSSALAAREAGRCLLSVLSGSSFALELETLPGFERGLTISKPAKD
jgi:putative molybdopterin biosynthesis protein